MENIINCPDCNETKMVKNGSIGFGKAKYKCNHCGRQFVLNPQKHPISVETKALIDRLLLERIERTGIVRATKVSERWLQNYVNEKYKNVPRRVIISRKKKGRLTIECDELWSFVGKKGNKQWVWLAIERDTREIVFEAKVFLRKTLASKGVFVGDRSRVRSQKLWDSLPGVFKNVQSVIPIFGSPLKRFFLVLVIVRLVKKPGFLPILNGSIVLLDSVFQD